MKYFYIKHIQSLRIQHMFYCSFSESVLTYCIVCWFGTLREKNRSKLNSIVNRGSKVVGVKQAGLNETRVKRKGLEMMSDLCHILSQYYNMHQASVIPVSVKFVNKT